MRRSMLISRESAIAIVASLVLAVTACNRGREISATASSDPPARESVATLPARPDPCGWVTPAEVAVILGPLAGAPTRGNHHDDPEPAKNGFACVYTLAPRPGDVAGADPNTVSVEVRTDDAPGQESGF